MKLINTKKKIILFAEILLAEAIGFIIQLNVKPENFKNIKMKTLIDNAIIIATIFAIIVVVIQIIYWYVTYLNTKIKELVVINKFNTIMLIKYENHFKSHPCQVFQHDMNLFTSEELKYLTKYIEYKNDLEVQVKGKNTVFGMFK